MSDITKCNGGSCPLKDNCKRYISEDSKFCQSYFIDIPFEEDKCEYFLKYDTRISNSDISI